jgi:cob(I)alamin adenosyltransferase
MKIYTKKGDKGTTQLIGGTRVSKAHIRIEAYGTVDELNSQLGVVITYVSDEKLKAYLTVIQSELFNLGALLAADPEKNTMPLPAVDATHVKQMERWIDAFQKPLPALKNFILPGGHTGVAHAHVARCVCRRAERCVVALSEHFPADPIWIQYLNRLSDLLFVIARYIGHEQGVTELVWKSR